ncbi:MAG: sll1863 family stress response protein [Thermoanaerobaculia bacterium]
MVDEPKKSLEEWGIDVEKFKERAKESLESARGDLTEITGTLRHTLVQAKDVLVGLQKSGSPAAAELKSGFERAWVEIESAFRAAREKAKAAPQDESAPPPEEPPLSS